MHDIDFVDGSSVLILEESPTLQALFDDWLGEIQTKVVSAPTDIPAEFDATVTVACLCQSALAGDGETVRKHILARNPYCQLVTILPRSSFVSIYDDDYDACLQRPIFEEEFQETIINRLKTGKYSSTLRDFYDLNARLLWLRRADTPEQIIADADIDKLLERHGQLTSQLNSLRDDLSTEDIEAISRSIDLHKRYLMEPATDADQGVESKYHPSRCPGCKLPWGVDHGNELGNGLVSIGAGVWKCTRCDEVIHGLGQSGRRVMRG